MSADLTVPPPMPPYVYGRECGENERVLPIERVYARDAIWSERVASLQARLEAATKAPSIAMRPMEADDGRNGWYIDRPPYSLYVARSAIESALNSTPERVSVPYAYTAPQADNDVAMIFRRNAPALQENMSPLEAFVHEVIMGAYRPSELPEKAALSLKRQANWKAKGEA